MILKINIITWAIVMALALVAAFPGQLFSSSSRERSSRSSQGNKEIASKSQRLALSRDTRPMPALPPSHFSTPPVDEASLQAHVKILETKLWSMGYTSARAYPIELNVAAKVKLATLVREQMSRSEPNHRHFVLVNYIPSDYYGYSHKLYGMPLTGNDYKRQMGLVDYADKNNKQIVALFTVWHRSSGQPIEENAIPRIGLYGAAQVTEAPGLHRQLPGEANGLDFTHDIYRVMHPPI